MSPDPRPPRRLLTNADVQALRQHACADFAAHVRAVESAFREHGNGTAMLLERQSIITDSDPNAARPRSFKIGAAVLGERGVIGVLTYPAGYGRPIDFRVQLSSARTGALLGIVEGEPLTHWATGAVTAVATGALARSDARVLALIGTGTYAFDQAIGIARVRELSEIRCVSRDATRRAAFARRLADALSGVAVTDTADVAQAMADADVVTTITTSHQPVFDASLLRPGMHVNAVGMHYPKTREVDTETVKRARVFVDDLPQTFLEKGEILIPIAEGAISREHVRGDLGALLTGRVDGRANDEELTLFGSGGTALEFVAVAAMLLEAAAETGIGQPLDA